MDKNKAVDPVSPETVLAKFKIYGLYHTKFIILIGILALVSSMHCTNYIFAAEDVEYRCKYQNCRDIDVLSLHSNRTIDFRCNKFDIINTTCVMENFNLSNYMKCDEWVYEKPNSFVAEFNLGCQDWKRTLIGTMHSTGYMIGLLFTGPISDKIGRKKLLIINAVIAGFVGLIKSVVTHYWLYVALEFLEPLIGEFYSPTFTLAVESVTKENRVLILCIVSSFSGIGAILAAFIAWTVSDWRNYVRALYAPALLFILYIFVMDESLRWLLNKGKKDEAKIIIKKAAKLNGMYIDENIVDGVKSVEKEANIDLRTLLKMTFTSKKLLIRLVSCVCMWFTTLFNAYVLIINSVSLEGNKYLNYGLISFSDLPASVILYGLLTKCKRKGPLIFTLTATGAFCMAQVFTPKGHPWISTALYIVGKMNASTSVRIVYLYTAELFPTHTRNTLHALCSSLGRVAAILAPQTPLLLRYWAGLPAIIVSILSLFTACLVTFMPETSDDVLPENVEQAECLGQKKDSNYMISRL